MTNIEWTDKTWNPVTGCDRVSPGCANCYALDLAARLKGMGQKRYQRDGDPKTSGPGFGLTLHPDKLEEPLRWRKPRLVLVNSMSDLFHEEIPDEYIARVFTIMERADHHVFQVLTKRPERMRDFLANAAPCEHGWLTHNGDNPTCYNGTGHILPDHKGWPLPNVWLGVSIENRRFVHRADLLRETAAAVRFVSADPLLGPLLNANPSDWHSPAGWDRGWLNLTDIDWLIAGGESGPSFRPPLDRRHMLESWVRALRDACLGHRTAFFLHQWGGRTPKAGGRELDGRTWDEWPTAREAVAA